MRREDWKICLFAIARGGALNLTGLRLNLRGDIQAHLSRPQLQVDSHSSMPEIVHKIDMTSSLIQYDGKWILNALILQRGLVGDPAKAK
jgi:hypothetical protein